MTFMALVVRQVCGVAWLWDKWREMDRGMAFAGILEKLPFSRYKELNFRKWTNILTVRKLTQPQMAGVALSRRDKISITTGMARGVTAAGHQCRRYCTAGRHLSSYVLYLRHSVVFLSAAAGLKPTLILMKPLWGLHYLLISKKALSVKCSVMDDCSLARLQQRVLKTLP